MTGRKNGRTDDDLPEYGHSSGADRHIFCAWVAGSNPVVRLMEFCVSRY